MTFGRTALWGLAVGGADGVDRVLRLLNEELVINMKLAGQKSTRHLTPGAIRRNDASGFVTPLVLDSRLQPEYALSHG